MENIKSNIEKIFDEFSEDLGHTSVSNRMSFDSMNTSYEINRKKRKFSDVNLNDSSVIELNNSSKSSLNDSSLNTSSTIVAASPWEARRMKADLIEAKSRIMLLKKEIEHQNTVQATTQLKQTHQISSLEKQLAHSTNKVSDLEKHLSVIRKREHALKEELVRTKNKLNIQKQTLEDKVFTLEQENRELEETLTFTSNDLNTEIRELNQQIADMDEQLQVTQDEIEKTKEINETLQEKSDSYDACKKELDAVKEKLSETESKVKSLEYEVGSYGDWKSLSKASHHRLSNFSDLEKEVARLREDSKKLYEVIGNKLLLEEQVADLQSRLERVVKDDSDNALIQHKVDNLEKELKDWQLIATDFCSKKSTVVTPPILRSYIEQILQKDLILASEKSSAKTEKHQMENQWTDLQTKNEKLNKECDENKRALKHHQNILQRLQKKLQLVVRERDCWKQLLENYEKDLTITPQSTINPDSQRMMRMEMLEKSVVGYKDLVAKLEGELLAVKSLPDMSMDSALNSEQYERLRNEIDSLSSENDRLRKRKEELELELETFTLRAQVNYDRYKVVHFQNNPAAEAYEAHKSQVEKLQAQVERLKMKVQKLEEGNEELTAKLSDTSMTTNLKDINALRTQVQSLESKNQHIKEVYKAASLEFREVCYKLFGFRVDRVGNINYRISSMYAEGEEEYLNFRLNDSGNVLNMLETEYSESLADLIHTHLSTHGSFPAFLSTLTLDLFNKTTVAMEAQS